MIHSSEDNQANLDNLLFCVTLLLVFIMAVRVPLDSDMWWHLKAGEWTVEHGSPLLMDVFSFTRSGAVWINHSWLGEVILYWFFKNAEFWGLGLCVALVASASMGILYKTMQGGSFFKAWFVVLAAIICSFVWSPRPQIFSLLIFTILLRLILKTWEQNGLKGVGWLLILFILWSNLHGGYGLGIFLLIFLFAGQVLEFLLRPSESEIQVGRFKRSIIWIAVALAGVLINPNGINTLIIPFKTVGVQTLQSLIDEWASPDFHQLAMQPFLVLLLTVILSLAFTRNPVSGFEVVGFIGFAYLALVAKRNFAPFAIFATFVAGNHLPAILADVGKNFKLRLPHALARKSENQVTILARLRRAVNLLIVGLLGIAAVVKWYYVTHPVVVSEFESRFYPHQAVLYMKDSGIPTGRMLNSYGWGGYLIWNMPETAVFVDGRTDLFDDDILRDWLNIVDAGNGWERTVEKWNISWFLIEPQRPVANRLIEKGWKVLYRDDISVVIVREDDTPD